MPDRTILSYKKMFRLTSLVSILQLTFFLQSEVNSARILGVFPSSSISHQFVFRKYVDELVNRGHEVVTITTHPKYRDGGSPDNLIEIDVSYSNEQFNKIMTDVSKEHFKRGVIIGVDEICHKYVDFIQMIVDQINFPAVKKVLEDKNLKFDLIVAEAFFNYHLIVRRIFDAPTILFSSFYGTPMSYEAMGAVGRHPILYPNILREKFGNMSYWETLRELYNEIKIKKIFLETDQIENKFLRQNYGPDAPTVQELQKDVDLLFLNSHPLFGNNRPVPPSVIHLGALHMEPKKELPKELEYYLNNSMRGVIYVSLGTNVRPSEMDKDLLHAFLDAFEALPYDILWKFDGDNLEKMPKNVKIQKWFPQRDLLVHPNIKLFVTQGGLQSTDEAIDAGVPLVGIAFLGDQWFNVNKYVELGIGVKVDAETMVATDLIAAINTVLYDDGYRKNMAHVRDVIRDQPQTPMERAMWWTEHVLRHGGKHLRSPAANITWSEYLMLDTLAPLLAVLMGVIVLAIIVVSKIFRSLFELNHKVKKS